jgi:ApaG protein
MEVAITDGIKVIVLAEYQPLYSDPTNFSYSFSYKIRIENNSDFTVQLKSRHWYIFDAIGEKYEIIGDGVVGFQPVIEPGQFHEYVSGCNFKSPFGKMHGTYTMEKVYNGKSFEIEIPPFQMIVPYILN